MRQEGISVRVARIFNTFGPRMHMNDGRVVSNFILQALQNDSITIYGSGKQTRSFQYVSDLVDGLVALMASNYTLPVNIGNPVEHTIESKSYLLYINYLYFYILPKLFPTFLFPRSNILIRFRVRTHNKRFGRRYQ